MNVRFTGRSAFLVFWDIFATYLALTLSSYGTRQADSILVSTDVLFSFGLLAIINVATFLAFRLYNNLWE
ncbi:MAG: polysaccharide biosynthesis protein, partial [Coriobacteriaceae bacterium]|nr:polysaccharide biosynthesis protein [Coriobacteriaceae bacterium]